MAVTRALEVLCRLAAWYSPQARGQRKRSASRALASNFKRSSEFAAIRNSGRSGASGTVTPGATATIRVGFGHRTPFVSHSNSRVLLRSHHQKSAPRNAQRLAVALWNHVARNAAAEQSHSSI